jgi:CheY-like chemotaxis protein
MAPSGGLDRGRNPSRWLRPNDGACYVLARAPQEAAPAAVARPRPLRVLVADDEEVSRKTLALMLRALGCEADEAETGLGALRRLAERRYDVVFLDLHMPEMDGFATARFVCAHWPAGSMPRLVALLPEGAERERAECRRAGFAEFALKPFRRTDLERILASG